jgi:16S rRNA (guanine527-N7)-methyltransferase
MSQAIASRLSAGLAALNLRLTAEQQQQLVAYLALLSRWNGAYNLTAIRDPLQMVDRHLLDSLALIPWLPAGPFIDVGSGAGLPGIPLLIATGQSGVTLLDSNGKKVRFLRQVVAELALDGVEVVQDRAEQFHPPAGYAAILSRAFAALTTMVSATRHLLADGGCWLAMKGAVPLDEIAALPADLQLTTTALHIPGLEHEQRHLITLRPSISTS